MSNVSIAFVFQIADVVSQILDVVVVQEIVFYKQ